MKNYDQAPAFTHEIGGFCYVLDGTLTVLTKVVVKCDIKELVGHPL